MGIEYNFLHMVEQQLELLLQQKMGRKVVQQADSAPKPKAAKKDHQITELAQKTSDLEHRLTTSLQQQAEVINQLIGLTGKLEHENKYLKES
jgi:hypothetical protein